MLVQIAFIYGVLLAMLTLGFTFGTVSEVLDVAFFIIYWYYGETVIILATEKESFVIIHVFLI